MPIMDSQLLLCESLSIAANVGQNTVATNVIDLGALLNHKGAALTAKPNVGQRLNLNIVVEDEDLAAALDSSAVTIELYADTDETPTTGGDVIASKVLTVTATSNYPDGTQICSIPLPNGEIKRYLGLKATIATQNLSTGKITAWIGSPIEQS